MDDERLQPRAEQDDAYRILAESYFLNDLESEGIGTSYDRDELIVAGDAACDALDDGLESREMFISVATRVPELDSTDSVAYLAGTATLYLCPEHIPG